MACSTARSRLLNVAVAVFTRTTLSTCLIQIDGLPAGLRFSGNGCRRIAKSSHLSCRFPARLATGQLVGPDPIPSCRTSPAPRGHAASPAAWVLRTPGRRDCCALSDSSVACAWSQCHGERARPGFRNAWATGRSTASTRRTAPTGAASVRYLASSSTCPTSRVRTFFASARARGPAGTVSLR
jgi:hypothetical protein